MPMEETTVSSSEDRSDCKGDITRRKRTQQQQERHEASNNWSRNRRAVPNVSIFYIFEVIF